MKKFTLSTIAATMLSISATPALADAYIGEQMQNTLTQLDITSSVMAVVTYDQL